MKMTIKEQLNELKDLAPFIKNLEEELAQGYPIYDFFADNLAEWEEQTLDSIKQLKSKRQAVIDLINRLDNPLHREILLVRYRDGIKWKDLPQSLNLPDTDIRRLHKQAIEELERVERELKEGKIS